MMRLDIYVCENFAPDYIAALKDQGFDDVTVRTFPCLCSRKRMKEETQNRFLDEDGSGVDKLIICSEFCDLVSSGTIRNHVYKVQTSNYCFNHLTNESLITYLVENGRYILANGWLRHWKRRLEDGGFDRLTAQAFYGEMCNELLLLDTGIDPESNKNIQALSEHLNLPYTVLDIGLENLKMHLKSIIFEWRLNQKNQAFSDAIADMRKQSAEHSAVLSIIEQISEVNQKRVVIEKIEQIFRMLFGAHAVHYFERISMTEYAEKSGYGLSSVTNGSTRYCLFDQENRLAIEIAHGDQVFGTLEAKDFLFPEHLQRYTNFALSIARVSGLAISNANQYEALEKTKDDATRASIHDTMTGLKNSNYFNQFISENSSRADSIVFMFDVDNLKTVNDKLGHLQGDQLIIMAGRILQECFRETDLLARIGGDEFVAVIFNGTSDLAGKTRDRILESMARNNQIANKTFKIGLSIGYACSGNTEVTWEDLIREADLRMYEDKVARKSANN